MKFHPSSSNRNASLEKASRVLAAFSEETPELGVMDLARRVGLNKSTASRFVSTLTQLGLLERTEGGRKVRLSLRLFELGMRAARHRPLVIEAQPILQRLTKDSGETAWLATPVEADVVFVSICVARPDACVVETGRRYPAEGGALGRLFEAVRSHELREVQTPPKMLDGSPDVAVDHGEFLRGTTFVAGAVVDRTGRTVGSVGIARQERRNGPTLVPSQVPLVRHAAADLSRRLGFLRTVDLDALDEESTSQQIA